ncbi:hypothetical protein MRX96_004447 [Rhipicephalus microplus]
MEECGWPPIRLVRRGLPRCASQVSWSLSRGAWLRLMGFNWRRARPPVPAGRRSTTSRRAASRLALARKSLVGALLLALWHRLSSDCGCVPPREEEERGCLGAYDDASYAYREARFVREHREPSLMSCQEVEKRFASRALVYIHTWFHMTRIRNTAAWPV